MRKIRNLFALVGVAAVLVVAMLFSPLPWKLYRWLSCADRVMGAEPDFIVVLGGGGIPSESGLMRTYQAAQAARAHPDAFVIVSLPGAGGDAMAKELEMREVNPLRIEREAEGRNTREQALRLVDRFKRDNPDPVVMIVTSPEHMLRSVRTFEKVGVPHVEASPAFAEAVGEDLRYGEEELGAARPGPPVGKSMLWRYRIWDNSLVLGKSIRELVALAYYKWMDWI